MNIRARATLAANHGLITRPQLMDAGVSTASIKNLIRRRALVIVRRGVYADGEMWDSLPSARERHRLRTRAATIHMRRDFVLSHDSAAYELGLEILEPPRPLVHVTRFGVTGAWTRHGIKHHLAPFGREQKVALGDLQALDLARTAVDLAREHGQPYGEIACDAALRLGVSRRALEDAVTAMASWPFVTRSRLAVDFAQPGAANVAETMGRLLVAELGLGEIDTQFPVEIDDGRVVWGDLRVGCHIFEVDGKVKYTPVEAGGVATSPITEVVWEERKRERAIRREGLGVSRIIYADFWEPQRTAALIRLREEYDDTAARYGTDLPERLSRNAARLRDRRPA
ncbi:hypothetical protein [Nocardioides sp.]|uniref:hypothetical protein n=1 Tax=Nocardioides sp. TaxID=35761 RepID=UPI00356B1965